MVLTSLYRPSSDPSSRMGNRLSYAYRWCPAWPGFVQLLRGERCSHSCVCLALPMYLHTTPSFLPTRSQILLSPPLAFSVFCHGSIALNPADLLLPSCANTVSREGWCKRAVLIRLPGVSSLVFKRWLRSHVLSAYSTAPDGRNTPCSVCVFSLIYNPHPA